MECISNVAMNEYLKKHRLTEAGKAVFEVLMVREEKEEEDGIMNYASKKEASVRCYDELFPYAKQIVSYLAANSGMQGLVLGKSDMVFDDINNTKLVDRTTSGKIIELQTGFRG